MNLDYFALSAFKKGNEQVMAPHPVFLPFFFQLDCWYLTMSPYFKLVSTINAQTVYELDA